MRSQELHKHQKESQPNMAKQSLVTAFLTLTIVCLFGFTGPSASAKEIQRLPHEPNNPKIHHVYFNTTDNREYIYNGQEWVPHDASIDTYVLKKYKKPKGSKNPSSGDGASNNMDSSNDQGVSK